MSEEERRAAGYETGRLMAELNKAKERNALFERLNSELEGIGEALEVLVSVQKSLTPLVTDEERASSEALMAEAARESPITDAGLAALHQLVKVMAVALARDDAPERDGMRALVTRVDEILAELAAIEGRSN